MSHPRPPATDLPPDPFHRSPGHERQLDRDIDVRRIVWTVLGILGLTVISMIAMWGLLSYLQGRAERTAPEVPAIRLQAADEPAPSPRLQASPERELIGMRAAEEELLSTYGPADGEAGTVRVPIERAMDMLAEQGAAIAPGSDRPVGVDSEAEASTPPDEAGGEP